MIPPLVRMVHASKGKSFLGASVAFVSPGTRDFVACNHLRSYKYYSSSILNPDGFLGYPCASYQEFQEVGHTGALGRCWWWPWWWWWLTLWRGTEQSCGPMTNMVTGNTKPHRAAFFNEQGALEGDSTDLTVQGPP